MNKFLLATLGNIGEEYKNTRHNAGFLVADYLAAENNIKFSNQRYADIARYSKKGKEIILIKPSTYMNLSGNAVRYWLQKEKIEMINFLVVVDELALPFGTIRMKPSGSDGGHNGLKHIQEILMTQNYARLRIGIDNRFSKGKQVDYVLGKWDDDEKKQLPEIIKKSAQACETFCLAGIEIAMTTFNKLEKK